MSWNSERVGFEPTVQLPVLRFSRPTRSTAPAPLQRDGEAGLPSNEFAPIIASAAGRNR